MNSPLADALRDRFVLERELGRGGMAVVYLAQDLRHDRPVALKVLSPELASIVGVERFLREIQVAARLVHPHIVPLLDSGEADGLPYYTMPFVEGESLRAKLAREKQLPLEDALQVASQVADALTYAHGQGVVHRDIKPGNILLEAGHAVVSDFGLARALSAAGGEDLTGTGLAIGTPAYMSPEQAAGERHVDTRADIYSLGCVLHEMLAGEPPFTGPTPQAVLAKRVSLPPPSIRTVREAVPESIEKVLFKALAKVPADRYATAGEFARALAASSIRESPRARRLRKPALLALGMLIVLLIPVAISSGIWSVWTRSPTGAPVHQQLTFLGSVVSVALSPDGKLLAYVSQQADSQVLMVREVSGGTPLEIASFNEICCVGWSPDNAEVRFGAETRDSLAQGTYITSRLGGTPRRISRAVRSTWGRDGSEVATWFPSDQRIWIGNTSSGAVDSIQLRGNFTWLEDVHWSPSGDRLAFLAVTEGPRSRWRIWTTRADGTEQHPVLEDSIGIQSPRWAPAGDALYYLREQGQTQDLWRIDVSSRDGSPHGKPSIVLAGSQFGPDPSYTISADGKTLVYTRAFRYSNLWLFARTPPSPAVNGRPLTTGTSTNAGPMISPDDSQIAFISSAERSLMTMPLEGGRLRRRTFLDAAPVLAPAWSPDGRRIAFGAVQQGTLRIWMTDLDRGTSLAFPRSVPSGSGGAISWSPGPRILYQAPGNRNYRVLDPDTQEERPLVQNDSVGWIFDPQYSPDARKVAVFWNRRPQPGLWLINLASDSQFLLRGGRYLPIGWAQDGAGVYALELVGSEEPWGRKVYRIAVATGDTTLAALFPSPVSWVQMTRNGRRFVVSLEEAKSDVWKIDNFDPRSN